MKKKNKVKKKDPLSYRNREYRQTMNSYGLISSHIVIRETDLFILATKDVRSPAKHLVLQYRGQLENYIATCPKFLTSLQPLPFDPLAPPIVKSMIEAALIAGVGPMAAVAGAISEYVGKGLLHETDEIIVENGGDIFLYRTKESMAAIFAGASPLSNKLGIKIPFDLMPIGVCTSSGTIGHSLSFGQADSVTVLAPSTSLADACATRLGNEMKTQMDMKKTLDIAKQLPGLHGVVIVHNDKLGVWGDIELVPLV